MQIAQRDRAQVLQEKPSAEPVSNARTPEFDFLLASVRRFFRPESPIPSKEGLDGRAVWELAGRHSVAEFLRYTGDSPAPAQSSVEAARSDLALSAELLKLADLFKNEGIDVVPLKGPVLGAALYDDKVLKTSTDIDLLVRRGDALRAKRALENSGYCLTTVPHWPSDKGYLRNVNDELSFTAPARYSKIDLHWRLLPGYFPPPFDDAAIWPHLRSVPWGNRRLQTLSPEQQLMFLCAHGVKHLWTRLGWLCDLARLIQVEPGINWAAVFEQTRRSHTTRMILLSLLLADNLLGVGLPPPAAAPIAADPQARVLAADVAERLRSDRPASMVETAIFCARASERTGQRVRLIFAMLQPTEAEYRIVQIPPFLYWVYYLFRPLRLAAKLGRRLMWFTGSSVIHARKA